MAGKVKPIEGETRTDDKSKRFFCALCHRTEEWTACEAVKITARLAPGELAAPAGPLEPVERQGLRARLGWRSDYRE